MQFTVAALTALLATASAGPIAQRANTESWTVSDFVATAQAHSNSIVSFNVTVVDLGRTVFCVSSTSAAGSLSPVDDVQCEVEESVYFSFQPDTTDSDASLSVSWAYQGDNRFFQAATLPRADFTHYISGSASGEAYNGPSSITLHPPP